MIYRYVIGALLLVVVACYGWISFQEQRYSRALEDMKAMQIKLHEYSRENKRLSDSYQKLEMTIQGYQASLINLQREKIEADEKLRKLEETSEEAKEYLDTTIPDDVYRMLLEGKD